MEQNKLLTLLEESFTEPEILDIALYIVSSHALGEAVLQAIAGKQDELKKVSPFLVDLVSKYDSALIKNDFYIKNYAVFKAFTIFDKIKLSSLMKIAAYGEESKDKNAFHALEHMMYSKMDSLIILAFLWKGYEFACEFMTKLHLVLELSPSLVEYFQQRG